MTTSLHLIRHGAVLPDNSMQFLGRTNLPLSDKGRDEAQRLASVLPDSNESIALFCSPLIRALQTCELALPGIEPVIDGNFTEIDFGEWELKTFAEIENASPELVKQWVDDSDHFEFPSGEGISRFRRRVCDAADQLKQCGHDNVFVVTHGGVIRTLICYFLGLSLNDYLLFNVRLGSLTTLRLHDGNGVLERLSYIPDLEVSCG